jgi:hypothetical protein
MLQAPLNSNGDLQAGVCEVDLEAKEIPFDDEYYEAQSRELRERKENVIKKWKARGEMWRLDLARELFRQKASVALADDLSCVQEAANMPASGLTNRQRRERYRSERRELRELTSHVESSFHI